MESVNIIKGYSKVSHLEAQPPTQNPTTRKLTTIAISAILFLTLILGVMVGSLVYESVTELPEELESPESPSVVSGASNPIKSVCNFTGYPNSCFSSMSSLNTSPNPDLKSIFKLSLQVSIAEISNISALLKTLQSDPALRDCRSLFDDALGRFGDSVKIMEVGSGEAVLTAAKISDIQTWISGALTDQETCLDGLEETDSAILDEVKNKIQRSKEFTSISLTIISKFQIILENPTMH